MARFVKAAGFFALLTVVMTWPQATRLATDAHEHQDVFFNMWRFGWTAHAISTAPFHLLDGNIFYPEPRTLTYSDAMPVEALIAAPSESSEALNALADESGEGAEIDAEVAAAEADAVLDSELDGDIEPHDEGDPELEAKLH